MHWSFHVLLYCPQTLNIDNYEYHDAKSHPPFWLMQDFQNFPFSPFLGILFAFKYFLPSIHCLLNAF